MKTGTKLLFAGICFLTSGVYAQTTPNLTDIHQRMDYINQHVTSLTPDQQTKILSIEEDYLSTVKTIRPAAVDSLGHTIDNRIRAVLSNEQWEQYQNLSMYPH